MDQFEEQTTYAFSLKYSLVGGLTSSQQFHQLFAQAMELNCSTFISPIFTDQYLQNCEDQNIDLDHCFLKSEESINKKWLKCLIPKLTPSLFNNPKLKKNGLKMIGGYCNYLGINSIVVDFSVPNQTLRQWINYAKKQLKNLNIALQIRVQGDDEECEKAWEKYVEFQVLQRDLQISIFLQIQPNLPSANKINRWKAQNILSICFQKECFTLNNKGFPILQFRHEKVLTQFMKIGNNCSITSPTEKVKEYFTYFKFIYKKKLVEGIQKRQKDAAYLMDYLRHPLQPYADNLQSQTYSAFEFDSPKYSEYEQALIQAFETFNQKKKIIVYYIGAGRGGLLFNVFKASKRTKRNVFVYALQKNPYPIQTIKKRVQQNKWTKNIEIVHTDVKEYQMPQTPDIFLSQLLGAIGDNQLSPQCLLWAEKNIAPHTLCIPTDYVSYIRPISYGKVHQNISIDDRHIYYTSNLGSYYSPFQSQKMWEFQHPLKSSQQMSDSLLERQGKCFFKAEESMLVNGFAGYFTSKLYGTAQLSILPEKPTFGMFSWYPIFFPFEEQILLRKGQTLIIYMRRICQQDKVWYEWSFSKEGQNQINSVVHNKDGWKVPIYL